MQTLLRGSVAVACLAAAAAALPATAQSTDTTAGAASSVSTARVTDTWRMPYQREFWNYVGASGGRSDYDVGCVSGFSCDQKDAGFKIFAGGKLYNVLGLEIGYVNLGRADIAGGATRAEGANVSLVAGIPVFGDRFGVNGKLGTTYGWTRTNVPVASSCVVPGTCNAYESAHGSGWGLSYGVGATYAITRNTELRVDWDRYRFDFNRAGDRDVDLWSAGVNLRF